MIQMNRLFIFFRRIAILFIFTYLITLFSDGENTDGGKDLRQQAGEIMACKYHEKK